MLNKLKDIKNNEDGLLSKLFRRVLMETGLIHSLTSNVDEYISNGGSKKKSSILKNVIDGEMTWKTFMFLLFEIMIFKKIKLKLEITHDSGIVTTHSIDVTPKKTIKPKKKLGDTDDSRKIITDN